MVFCVARYGKSEKKIKKQKNKRMAVAQQQIFVLRQKITSHHEFTNN